MCSKFWRCCSLLLLSFSIGSFCAYSATGNEPQVLEQISGATVRIFARDGSLGSGSVFAKNDKEIHILTNAHVAGGIRAQVKVEFWYQGRLSKKVPGVVIKSFMSNQSDHDYSVVSINKEDLGSYFDLLNPIPLAEVDFVPDFSKIYSAGCPQGTWQTHWIGHGTENLDQQAVKFVPMPANGRSGSAIYQVLDGGKLVQVGVITYRTKSPGKDGTSETDGEGIAQTISHIRNHMDGRAEFTTYRDLVDDSHYEAVPVQECPGGICPPIEQSIMVTGQVEKYTLKYIDPSAEGRSQPGLNPLLLSELNGKLTTQPTQQSELDIFPSLPKKLDNCPEGTCPKPAPKVDPQPQELPQRREIFPNLPKPEILPGEIKPIERLRESQPIERLSDPKLLEHLGQLRQGQSDQTGLLLNIRERFDRRMDLVEQQLEIQRQQMQQSIKEGVENVEKGIVGRLLDLPLIRQVRWLVRVLFWPLVLFAIWWVPAFLLNLGPLWFLPVIRAVKGFFQAAFAGLKEIFAKKKAPAPTEDELAKMIADIINKGKNNE